MSTNEGQFDPNSNPLLRAHLVDQQAKERRKAADLEFLRDHVARSGHERWAVKDSDWEVVREPAKDPSGYMSGASKRSKTQRLYGLISRTTGRPPKYSGGGWVYRTVIDAAREAKRTPHEID